MQNETFTASLVPASRNATTNGVSVDRSNAKSVDLVVIAGAIVDGTHSIALQGSDDGATWADVPAGDQVGSFTANLAANTTQRVSYLGTRQYLRARLVVSGATTGATVCAVLALADLRKA